jgi:hypothetical protein
VLAVESRGPEVVWSVTIFMCDNGAGLLCVRDSLTLRQNQPITPYKWELQIRPLVKASSNLCGVNTSGLIFRDRIAYWHGS